MGGPCDFSVSPSPFGLDFGSLDFGTLGIDNKSASVIHGDSYALDVRLLNNNHTIKLYLPT